MLSFVWRTSSTTISWWEFMEDLALRYYEYLFFSLTQKIQKCIVYSILDIKITKSFFCINGYSLLLTHHYFYQMTILRCVPSSKIPAKIQCIYCTFILRYGQYHSNGIWSSMISELWEAKPHPLIWSTGLWRLET